MKGGKGFGGASPCLKPPFHATPGHPRFEARVAAPFLRDRKGWQQSCSPRPLVTPALLHLRAVACRSARRASVPASGTWRRPRGKATKPCCCLSFPLGKGKPLPRRGGASSPPRGGRPPKGAPCARHCRTSAGKGVVLATCALIAKTAGSGVGSEEPQHTPPGRLCYQCTSHKHNATSHGRRAEG